MSMRHRYEKYRWTYAIKTHRNESHGGGVELCSPVCASACKALWPVKLYSGLWRLLYPQPPSLESSATVNVVDSRP